MLNDSEKFQWVQNLIGFVTNPLFIWPCIVFLLIVAAICAHLINKHEIKISRKIFFVVWLCFLASEIFKEVFLCVCLDYPIVENLPIQFCALPIYCFLGLAIIKNKFWNDVFKVFSSIYLLAIGLLFWSYPNVLFQMQTYVEVFQSITWHFALVFLGMFNLLIFKTYSLKYFKNFTVAILLFVAFIIPGTILNWYFQDVPCVFFYCLPTGSVYPVINLYWHSVSPYPAYVCVFVLSFIVLCYLVFFGTWILAKLFGLINSVLRSFKQS